MVAPSLKMKLHRYSEHTPYSGWAPFPTGRVLVEPHQSLGYDNTAVLGDLRSRTGSGLMTSRWRPGSSWLPASPRIYLWLFGRSQNSPARSLTCVFLPQTTDLTITLEASSSDSRGERPEFLPHVWMRGSGRRRQLPRRAPPPPRRTTHVASGCAVANLRGRS